MSTDKTHTPHHDATNATTLVRYLMLRNIRKPSLVETHTFSFITFLNPFALIILTMESLGYKAAETEDGTRARVKDNRWR